MLRESQIESLICQTLLEMLREKSLVQIKVTELVTLARISRSSFYTYFDGIDDVVQKIEDDFIAGLDTVESLSLSDFQAGKNQQIHKVLHYIEDNMEIYAILSSDNGEPYFQYRLTNRSMKILEELVSLVPTNLSPVELRLLVEQMCGGRWQMYKWWSQNREKVSLDEIFHVTQKMIQQFFQFLEN